MKIRSLRILLVGATGGIGQCIAEKLSDAGAELILVGRNRKKLDWMRSNINNRRGHIPDIIETDISGIKGRNEIMETVRQYPDGINTVINCAGINHFQMFENIDEEKLQEIININLIASLSLTRLLLPHLKKQPSAYIVNIGSTFGSIGFAGFSVYCASKFAIRGFSEALRRELADTGITVFYISPRATDTKLNTPNIDNLNCSLKANVDQPEDVAKQIIEILTAGTKEAFIGWQERIFIKINSIFPRLVDRILLKQLPVIKNHVYEKNYLN